MRLLLCLAVILGSVGCCATPDKPEEFRNIPKEHPDKWEEFIDYLRYDVLSEREALGRLDYCNFPQSEIDLYRLDQDINDNGIAVDMELAERAEALNDEYCEGPHRYNG